MRETRRTVPMFSFYDRTGIQNYLETMAVKGWMLEKAGTICWKFRRMEPKKLKFSVVYFPEADMYDPAPGEGEQTFREFCEHSGWRFLGSQAQMQIFCNESSDPVPIDTDPVIEVENIHHSMKKSTLPGYWLMMVTALLQILSQSIRLFDDPVSYLAYDIDLYFILFWPSMLLVCLVRLICYHRWRSAAKRAAEDGIFLETRGSQRLEGGWAILSLGGLAAALIFGHSPFTACAVIIGTGVGIALVAAEAVTREALKKRGYGAKANKMTTIAVGLAVIIVFIAIVTPIAISVADRSVDRKNGERLLELSDLLDAEYRTLVLEDTESALLGYQRIVQYTGKMGENGEIQYQLIHVKAGSLYDLCLNNLGIGNAWELVPADSAPWDADRVWMCVDGDEVGGFVLCYENYILCLWPNWEMTEAQMATVGSIFN